MASCNEDLSTNEFETQEKNIIIENAKQSVQTVFSNYENKDLVQSKSSFQNGKAIARIFKIHRSIGTVSSVYPSEECSPYAQVITTGEGNATFVGHFTVLIKYCVDMGGNPQSLITADMTAANGDVINTIMIRGYYIDNLFYSDYIIVGGTGRFENATGNITLYGLYDTEAFNVEGEGLITF